MRVYLLSTYDEYGSEGVVGTADRDALDGLLWERCVGGKLPYWAKDPESIAKYHQNCRQWYEESKAGLERALKAIDDGKQPLGEPRNLNDCWGGMQLHVIDLQAKPKTIPDSRK